MFRFDWLWRLLVVLASIVVVAGSLAGCGEEEQAGPEGVPLPSDFPVTQVPLIDGHVLSASGTRADAGRSPSRARRMPQPARRGGEEAHRRGYTESHRSTEGGQSVAVLSASKGGSTFWVQIGASPQAAGGGSSVFYLVNAE